MENPYTFTGREYDAETGLYYYRARYYAPELGRFLQKDPIGIAGGLNGYVYVGNNPVNAVDPWGEDLILVGQGGALNFLLKHAARTWQDENGGSSSNRIVEVSSGQEAITAMRNYYQDYGLIDGLQIFAHGASYGIYFRQGTGTDSLYVDAEQFQEMTSNTMAFIFDIERYWFADNAKIKLWSCKTASPITTADATWYPFADSKDSFAEQLANHLNISVTGSPVGLSFYYDSLGTNPVVNASDVAENYTGSIYGMPDWYRNNGWTRNWTTY